MPLMLYRSMRPFFFGVATSISSLSSLALALALAVRHWRKHWLEALVEIDLIFWRFTIQPFREDEDSFTRLISGRSLTP